MSCKKSVYQALFFTELLYFRTRSDRTEEEMERDLEVFSISYM